MTSQRPWLPLLWKYGARIPKVSSSYSVGGRRIDFFKDPIFISILTEILIHLAGSQTSGVYQTVVQNALPPLTNAIASAKKDESWIASGAIDLVTSLVRGAPESGLGDGFIGLLAPTLFACLDIAEDRDVLQVCEDPPFIHLSSYDICRMAWFA